MSKKTPDQLHQKIRDLLWKHKNLTGYEMIGVLRYSAAEIERDFLEAETRVERTPEELAECEEDLAVADPHLPPPAVCEWLLAQDWGQPIDMIEMTFPAGHPSGLKHCIRCGYHEATVAIGADETAHIQLPDSALALLREQFPAHHPV